MAIKRAELTSEDIKRYARKLGADLVGIASIETFKDALDEQKPVRYLPETRSLISIGVKIQDSILDNLPITRRGYMATYTTVNEKLNHIAFGLARFLENRGYKAVHYPAAKPYNEKLIIGDISHRHVALKAGLGEIGYSGLLLTPQYGPRIRFNTVITDAILKPDLPYRGSKLCKYPNCNKCVEICPPKAQASTKIEYIHPIGRVFDKLKCKRYMDETLKGLVCGMCVKVCPSGKR